MMKKRPGLWLMVVLCTLAIAPTSLTSQEKGGNGATGPYELVANWPQNPCGDGYQVGSTAGIFAESPDNVFIFQRGCLPVLKPEDGSGGGEAARGGRGAESPRASSRPATHQGSTCRRRIQRASPDGITTSTSSTVTAR